MNMREKGKQAQELSRLMMGHSLGLSLDVVTAACGLCLIKSLIEVVDSCEIRGDGKERLLEFFDSFVAGMRVDFVNTIDLVESEGQENGNGTDKRNPVQSRTKNGYQGS